jgi:hypothetical protein
MRNRLSIGWAGLVATAIATSPIGCGGAFEAHPPRSVYVARPPPEPLPEIKSGPSAAGMDWIGGYWHFNGTDYVWIPGHWESPRPGWAWKSPAVVYSQQRRAWVYEHGRWEPADPRVVEAKAVR